MLVISFLLLSFVFGLPIYYICIYILQSRIKKRKEEEITLDEKAEKIAYKMKLHGFSNFVRVGDKIFFINGDLKKWAYWDLINKKIEVFDFKELIDYSIYKDNQDMVESTAGNALIGGVLFGGLGAIAGANSSKNVIETEKSLIFKITVNRLDNPLIRFVIYNFDNPIKLEVDEKEKYLARADKLNSYLSYIKKNT